MSDIVSKKRTITKIATNHIDFYDEPVRVPDSKFWCIGTMKSEPEVKIHVRRKWMDCVVGLKRPTVPSAVEGLKNYDDDIHENIRFALVPTQRRVIQFA